MQTLLSRTQTRIEVFVAGPYLEPATAIEDIEAGATSVRLRAHLRDLIRRNNHDVSLGEHRGVSEITSESIPQSSSIAASELALVKRADAVIVIPDSPGSFCEVGAWSMIPSVCRKSLILPNSKFENEAGYLQGALLPLLSKEYAKVIWLDYNDLLRADDITLDFLDGVIDRKIFESLKNG